MSEDEKLTLTTHLAELRKRLIRSVIAVAITTAASFFFAKQVFEVFKSRAEDLDLIFIEVTELLGVYFKVAIYCGIALALPFLIYELVMFVRPALTSKEKRYLYLSLPSVFLLFASGAIFAYYILLPPALNFLLDPPFAEGIATPEIRVGNYISLVTRFILVIGLVFQTPLLIFILAKIGVVTPQWLASHRALAIVGAFIIGAIVTPTWDPINQTMVSLPIIILYEFGIWLARFARRPKGDEAALPPEEG